MDRKRFTTVHTTYTLLANGKHPQPRSTFSIAPRPPQSQGTRCLIYKSQTIAPLSRSLNDPTGALSHLRTAGVTRASASVTGPTAGGARTPNRAVLSPFKARSWRPDGAVAEGPQEGGPRDLRCYVPARLPPS